MIQGEDRKEKVIDRMEAKRLTDEKEVQKFF